MRNRLRVDSPKTSGSKAVTISKIGPFPRDNSCKLRTGGMGSQKIRVSFESAVEMIPFVLLIGRGPSATPDHLVFLRQKSNGEKQAEFGNGKVLL